MECQHFGQYFLNLIICLLPRIPPSLQGVLTIEKHLASEKYISRRSLYSTHIRYYR